MNICSEGEFVTFEMTSEEKAAALASPYLLAYLHTKRAEYGAAFLKTSFVEGVNNALDTQKIILNVVEQQAKFAMLTELIEECIESAESVDRARQEIAEQKQTSAKSNQPPTGF